MKTDCKNCEFFFNETSLRNVDKVKIETVVTVNPEKHMSDIISLLENCGFECSMYKITPHDYSSTKLLAHILGKKVKNWGLLTN